MADTREKLIELIAKAKRSMWGKSGLSCELARNSYIAEFFIANGVRLEEKQATSQATSDESKRFAEDTNVPSNDVPDTNVGKWISVKERLPEPLKDVLVVVSDGYGTFVDMDFLMHDGSWAFEAGGRRVTHWMPIPEPPKGE